MTPIGELNLDWADSEQGYTCQVKSMKSGFSEWYIICNWPLPLLNPGHNYAHPPLQKILFPVEHKTVKSGGTHPYVTFSLAWTITWEQYTWRWFLGFSFSFLSTKQGETGARYGLLDLVSGNVQLNPRPLLLVMQNKQDDQLPIKECPMGQNIYKMCCQERWIICQVLFHAEMHLLMTS